MGSNYTVINLKQYLDAKGKNLLPDDQIYKDFGSFSCGPNADVERFLLNNSISFSRKKQSVSYCVYDGDKHLVGYFALAVKPVTFCSEVLSKTAQKVVERISKYDANTKEYSASGYLIAQLGKNFRIAKELQIPGSHLLNIAISTIQQAQNLVGGTIVFLECESHPKLMSFYEQNLFRQFSSRITDNSNNEGLVLNQMFRLI